MTLSISAYNFSSMVGEIGGYGESIHEIIRPGKDGSDIKKTGKRGEPFQLRTISTHSSESEARTIKNEYERAIGDRVKVVKGPEEVTSILINGVSSTIRKIEASTDGNSWAVETYWSMKRVG